MAQKKNTHTEKILKGLSKKASSKSQKAGVNSLREQYNVIREDILKLREDLQKGYDLAKGAVEKKSLINQFFKSR